MVKVIIKSIKIIFFLAVVFSFIVVGSFFYQTKKHPEQIPNILGYSPLTVLSNSMQPNFAAGDIVLIKRIDNKNLKKKDVITFKNSENKFITHRIIKVQQKNGETRYVTKGDNNNIADEELVSSKNITGKLIFIVPGLGNVSQFLAGPIGFILFIIVPLTGYVCLEVYSRMAKSAMKKASVNGE